MYVFTIDATGLEWNVSMFDGINVLFLCMLCCGNGVRKMISFYPDRPEDVSTKLENEK